MTVRGGFQSSILGRLTATGLAAVVSLQAGPVSAQAALHQWTAHPEAVRYDGRIEQDGKLIHFRATEPRIYLPSGAKVEVDAIDKNGRIIATEQVGGEAVAATPPQEAVEPEPQEPPKPVDEPPLDPAKDPNNPWPPSEPSAKDVNHVSLAVGFGKQTIKASAGVSKFEGSDSIGGTLLGVQHQPAKSQWIFDAVAILHAFGTEVKEPDAATGSVAVKKTRFLHVLLHGGGMYDFLYADPEHYLALGGGLALSRTPGLEITETTTKEATLTDQSIVAPYLEIAYAWQRQNSAHAGGSIWLAPLAVNPGVHGRSYGLNGYYRHFLTPSWTADATLTYRSESLNFDQDCGKVANCESTSKTDATITQFLLGASYHL